MNANPVATNDSFDVPEPPYGSLLEFDEGDCYHYGVYIGRGYVLDTIGVASGQNFGKVVMRGLPGPWRPTGRVTDKPLESLLQLLPTQVDYDLFINNCWGLWKLVFPDLEDWAVRQLPGGVFHSQHQHWNRAITQDYAAEMSDNIFCFAKSFLVVFCKLSKRVLRDFKPMCLYHLIRTTEESPRGILATLSRILELYEVDAVGLFESWLFEAAYDWRDTLLSVVSGFGVFLSFLFSKPLDWLNKQLKRLVAAVKGSTDIKSAANSMANYLKAIFPELLREPIDDDKDALETLGWCMLEANAPDLSDPTTHTMALQMAQQLVKSMKKHYDKADMADKKSIEPYVRKAEGYLASLALSSMTYTERKRPYVVFITGPPGCGKTTMARAIAKQVAEAKNSGVYQMTTDVDHWDSYTNQAVVLWEDYGAIDIAKDAPMLQRMADTAPLTLNCDKIENKGRCFTSSHIIITSNWPSPAHTSMAFPDAILRRVDLHVFADSSVMRTWSTLGRHGPAPAGDGFSHMTLFMLPPMSIDITGRTIYGNQVVRRPTTYGDILGRTLRGALQAPAPTCWADCPELDEAGVLQRLGISRLRALTLVGKVRSGEDIKPRWRGGPARGRLLHFAAYGWDDGTKTCYRFVSDDGTVYQNTTADPVWAQPTPQPVSNQEELEDVLFDVAKMRPRPIPGWDPSKAFPPHRAFTGVSFWNMMLNTREICKLSLNLLRTMLFANAISDSNRTAEKLNWVDDALEGRPTKRRGNHGKTKRRRFKGPRLSGAAYDDFCQRRDDAAARGIRYTMADYLDDIGYNDPEEAVLDGEDYIHQADQIMREERRGRRSKESFNWNMQAGTTLVALRSGRTPVGYGLLEGERLHTVKHVYEASDNMSLVGLDEAKPLPPIRFEHAEHVILDSPWQPRPAVAVEAPIAGQQVFLHGTRGVVKGVYIKTLSLTISGKPIKGGMIRVFHGTTVEGDCGRPWRAGPDSIVGLHCARLSGTDTVLFQAMRLLRLEAAKDPPRPSVVQRRPLALGTELWLTPYGARNPARQCGLPLIGADDTRDWVPKHTLQDLVDIGIKPFLEPDTRVEPPEAGWVKHQVEVMVRRLVGTTKALTAQEAFDTLEPSTSCGYPLYVAKNSGDPKIQRTVEFCQEVLSGEKHWHPVVYTAALKDEPLSLAKLSAGKRRLLFCAPLEASILSAALWNGVSVMLKKTRFLWPGCVGIVPNREWGDLVAGLHTGHPVYGADYSRWDSSVPNWALTAALTIIGRCCNHSLSLRYARELAKPFWVIAGNNCHLIRRGLPSGIPLTSTLNCLIHWICSWTALRQAGMSVDRILNQSALFVYGDDEVISIPRGLSGPYFQAMRCLGFHPTGPDKTEVIPEETPETFSFLSRTTSWVGGAFVGALKQSSILRQLDFCRGPSHKNLEATRAPTHDYDTQLQVALAEASLHGKEFFYNFAGCVGRALSTIGHTVDNWGYSAYLSFYLSQAWRMEGGGSTGAPTSEGQAAPAGTVVPMEVDHQPLPENPSGLALAPTVNPIDPFILNTFAQVPQGGFTCGPASPTNVLLFKLEISPAMNPWTNHLWQMYAGWSGGFEIAVQLAGNAFCSGKIIFFVLPPGSQEPNNALAATCYPHVIVDLRTADNMRMTVPDIKGVSFHMRQDSAPLGHFCAMVFMPMRATTQTADFVVEGVILSKPLPDFAFSMVVPPTQEIVEASWRMPRTPVAFMTNPRVPMSQISALVSTPAYQSVNWQLGRYNYNTETPEGASTLACAARWPQIVETSADGTNWQVLQEPDYVNPVVIGEMPVGRGTWDWGGDTLLFVESYSQSGAVGGQWNTLNAGRTFYGNSGNFTPDALPVILRDRLVVITPVQCDPGLTELQLNTTPRSVWQWDDAAPALVLPNSSESFLFFASPAPSQSTARQEIFSLMTPEVFTSFLDQGNAWPPGSVALFSIVYQGQVVAQAKLWPQGCMTTLNFGGVRRWDSSATLEFEAWVGPSYFLRPTTTTVLRRYR
nr:polyprotein [Stoat valovirus 1]